MNVLTGKRSPERSGKRQYGGDRIWRNYSAVQDTAEVNYNTHLKTEETGYISDRTLGSSVHSCLMVVCDGLLLGIPDQRDYNYRPEAPPRKRVLEYVPGLPIK
jgi:hypothetical protein